MSDPIEQLNRLGDALEGAPMPRPATEIRARGDRIRRRKHAVIAGVSAAVVAAVAIPVAALTLGGSHDADHDFAPAPSRSVSDPVPSAPLSAENLLTNDDAGQIYGIDSSWVASSTYRGDGQAGFHPCAESSFAGLGAKPVFKREFDPVPSKFITGWMTAIAGEFPSAAEAKAAYDDLSASLAACTRADTLGTDYTVEAEQDVNLGIGDEAHRILASYVPYDTQGFKEELETGLVLSGSRLEVVVSGVGAQDYVEQMSKILPKAAHRLVLGGGAWIDVPLQGDWPTTIRADFPLASGWPEPDGDSHFDPPSADLESMTAAGDLEACGNTAVDPGATARLTTVLRPPAAGYVRELQLFPTDQEAITYVAHLRALYDGCPTEGSNPTITTVVSDGAFGDESVLVTREGEGTFRTVINVVRVGNGVVVDSASDEGSDVAALVTETQENLADVLAQLNELAGAGIPGVRG